MIQSDRIFASPSQQGYTVSYSTSLAIFWRRTPYSYSGHTRESGLREICASIPPKNARLGSCLRKPRDVLVICILCVAGVNNVIIAISDE